jgi:hypothetical protein
MKEQEDILVIAYEREQYKPMVLGLMNGLPGLMKLQVSQDETGINGDTTTTMTIRRAEDGIEWQGGRAVPIFNLVILISCIG